MGISSGLQIAPQEAAKLIYTPEFQVYKRNLAKSTLSKIRNAGPEY